MTQAHPDLIRPRREDECGTCGHSECKANHGPGWVEMYVLAPVSIAVVAAAFGGLFDGASSVSSKQAVSTTAAAHVKH